MIFEPAFLGVVFKSFLLTLLLFGLMFAAMQYGLQHLPPLPGHWLGVAINLIASLLVVLAFLFLGAPVAALFASLSLNGVAKRIEAKYYPADTQGSGAPMLTDVFFGLRLAAEVIVVAPPSLPADVMLPGVGSSATLVAAAGSSAGNSSNLPLSGIFHDRMPMHAQAPCDRNPRCRHRHCTAFDDFRRAFLCTVVRDSVYGACVSALSTPGARVTWMAPQPGRLLVAVLCTFVFACTTPPAPPPRIALPARASRGVSRPASQALKRRNCGSRSVRRVRAQGWSGRDVALRYHLLQGVFLPVPGR